MGKKYRRYKNALEKYLSSENGRRFFHVTYSVGAAVVLLGALFKLNHYPFGNAVLLVGLGTEVFIFLLSAFDRPIKEYAWEDVFPEFATPEQLEQKKFYEERQRQKSQDICPDVIVPEPTATTVTTPQPNIGKPGSPIAGRPSAGFDERSIQTESRQTFTPPASALAEPSSSGLDVPFVSAELPSFVQRGGGAAPEGFTPDMASASEKYIAQVNRMSENVEKFTELTQSLNQISDVLANSFKHITDNTEGIGISTRGYVSQMENLNRNISGLNTIYEIQLKGVSSQINAIDEINSGLNRIKNLYEGAIPDSSVFRAETEKLALQLKDLNLVYARMLQAMTVNMGMGGGFSEAPNGTTKE